MDDPYPPYYEALQERILQLEERLDGIENTPLKYVIENKDAFTWLYLLLSALSIFLMQAGFALLEVGTVQAKNAKSILFKNTLDATVSMMIWWFIGFGISGSGASGQSGHNFINLTGEQTLSFIHSYVFAGTAATIVSGGVAERMNFSAYILFSVFMVGLIYPMLVYWAAAEDGWLQHLGYRDFAGAGTIHLCGGTAALCGATLLGPRAGRFKTEDGMVEVVELKGHSPVLSNLGTFILLFGWLHFNGSSVLGGDIESLMSAVRAIQNTLLSVSGCALSSFCYHSWWPLKEGQVHTHNLEDLNNSVLAGAVAITGACAYVDGWAAILIGVVGFFFYTWCSNNIMKFHIDDPLDAAAVHGSSGLWGVVSVGLLANPKHLDGYGSLFYTGDGRLLGIQLLGAVVIIAWTTAIGIILLKIIDLVPGFQLRVSKDAELLGLDFAYHDGFAYPGLTSEDILLHHELKAAERRVEARNKGMKASRKKVKDLKQRKKKVKIAVENGVQTPIECSESASDVSSMTATGIDSSEFKSSKSFKRAFTKNKKESAVSDQNIETVPSSVRSLNPINESDKNTNGHSITISMDKQDSGGISQSACSVSSGDQNDQC